jgi:hypothetical protein
MYKIFLALFIFNSFASGAQDYKSDFKKSIKFYSSATDLSMSVNVKTFESSNDKTGTSLGSGKMYRSSKKYYSNFMNTEIIDDGNKVLMIDHADKQASYYPDHSIIGNIPVIDKDMDSLLKSADSVIYIGAKEGGIQYTCYGKKEDLISKYNITFSSKDYHVSKIEYFYNQKNKDFEIEQYKLIVNYTSVSTSKVTETEKFKLENYISSNDKGYVLKSKYSGYKLQVTDKKKVLNKYIKG